MNLRKMFLFGYYFNYSIYYGKYIYIFLNKLISTTLRRNSWNNNFDYFYDSQTNEYAKFATNFTVIKQFFRLRIDFESVIYPFCNFDDPIAVYHFHPKYLITYPVCNQLNLSLFLKILPFFRFYFTQVLLSNTCYF